MARPDEPVSFLASQKGVDFAAGIGIKRRIRAREIEV